MLSFKFPIIFLPLWNALNFSNPLDSLQVYYSFYIFYLLFLSLNILNLFRKPTVFLISQYLHYSGSDSVLCYFCCFAPTVFDVLLLLTMNSYFGELDLRESFEVRVETQFVQRRFAFCLVPGTCLDQDHFNYISLGFIGSPQVCELQLQSTWEITCCYVYSQGRFPPSIHYQILI